MTKPQARENATFTFRLLWTHHCCTWNSLHKCCFNAFKEAREMWEFNFVSSFPTLTDLYDILSQLRLFTATILLRFSGSGRSRPMAKSSVRTSQTQLPRHRRSPSNTISTVYGGILASINRAQWQTERQSPVQLDHLRPTTGASAIWRITCFSRTFDVRPDVETLLFIHDCFRTDMRNIT